MITQQLQEDVTKALKNHESEKAGVVRILLSEIHNEEITLHGQGKELTDADILRVLQRSAKKHTESIEIYTQAGRSELADKEKSELLIIQTYLPQQMSAEDVEKIVDEAVASSSDKNFGAVMKVAMEKLRGQADGKVVSEMVKKKLG